MDLFADSDDDRIATAYALKVNNDFAKKYDARKRGEELSKLKDKYGSDYEEGDGDDDDSSTQYSSEDSEAEFVTPQVDAAILKMISRIRNKDADLYKAEATTKDFFDEEEKRLAQLASANKAGKANGVKKDKSKPVKLKDFQRTALLAGVVDDDEREEPIASTSYLPIKTPAQSAIDLQDETKAAFLAAVDGDDDDETGLLVKRPAANDSGDDDDQYRRFLVDALGEAELQKALALRPDQQDSDDKAATQAATASAPDTADKKRKKKKATKETGLASKHVNTNGQTDDDFLRNYILNRGWLDKKSKHRPSYKEIVADTEEDAVPAPGPLGANAQPLLDDSEDEFERAEEFETQYNFRYEEAEGDQLTTHGRDAADMQSVRKVDESRKQARQAVKDRKAAEKAERTEELKRMKNLKRQEILDKIAKIRAVAGAEDGFDFESLDLEGEYDLDKHAQSMSRVFDSKFYENEAVDENGKPVWDDEIEVDDIISGLNRYDDAYAPGGEAYDPTEPGPSRKKGKSERKKDKKRKRAKTDEGGPLNGTEEDEAHTNGHAEQLDPAEFDGIEDPEERKRRIEQYMDEYYKLDYEDMIGDQQTRFKYSQGGAFNPAGTKADPYALSAVDILMATDAELNAYESLRRLAPYRSTSADRDAKKRKRAKELRRVISSRKWGDEMPEEGQEAYFARPKEHRIATKASKTEDAAIANGEGGKKKRKGAKERKKQKVKAEVAAAAD